jgi:hexosaminidase
MNGNKTIVKSIVIGLLFSFVVFLAFLIYVHCKTDYEIRRTLNTDIYKQKLAGLSKDRIDSNSIVFIGNSLIDDFNLSVFNNPNVVNQGISGDFTAGLINRINKVLERHPAKLFIEIGINDLIEKVSLQTIFTNYDTILHRVTTISTRSKVYVHSLLPTLRPRSLITTSTEVNKRVMKFNLMLLGLAQKYHVTYIDTWSHFAMKDNSMNPAISTDGIHLTPEGYLIWSNLIKDAVNGK